MPGATGRVGSVQEPWICLQASVELIALVEAAGAAIHTGHACMHG